MGNKEAKMVRGEMERRKETRELRKEGKPGSNGRKGKQVASGRSEGKGRQQADCVVRGAGGKAKKDERETRT